MDGGRARRLRGALARLDEARAARAFYAVVGLGVCAGAFLVLHGDAFWYDEVFYLGLLRLPLAEAMSRYILADVHPPLYFLALGAWTQVFGVSEAAVRSLSALGALGALAVLWWRGGGQASRAALALASLWLATHWMWVLYAREARMYGLAMLGGCWLALAFARLWNLGREPFLRELWAFCLGALLVAFLHYSAMALACSALLLLLFRHRRRPGLCLPLAVAGALCVAWTVWHGLHILRGGHIGKLQVADLSGLLASALALWNAFFPGRFHHHIYLAPMPSTLLAWAGLLCVYGPMAVAWVRRGRLGAAGSPAAREDPDRALLRGLLPLLGVFLVAMSLAHEYQPLLVQKVVAVVLPSLALCVGCVAAILWRGRGWLLCALALVLAAVSLPVAVRGLDERWLRGLPYHREGFRELAMRLEGEPGGRRVYCMCTPHRQVAAFWESPGLAGRHSRGLGAVTGLRRQDLRHLVLPVFLVGLQRRMERVFLEDGGDFAVRSLGAEDGGRPMDSVHVFRVYHLAPEAGAGPQ